MLTALAFASTASVAATSQSAPAFECKLPYAAAMQSLGSLTVLEERAPNVLERPFGVLGVIEFEANQVTVFGQAPSSLTLTLSQPLGREELGLPKIVKAKYVAKFETSKAADTAILAENAWSGTACTSQGICGLDADDENPGTVLYRRSSSEFLEFECSVSVREDQL